MLCILIDQYLAGKMDARTFCNEYYYCFDLEIDNTSLTDLEEKAFSELSVVVDRFSEFEADHKEYPNAFFSEEQLKQKVIDIKHVLMP